jgi:hypothetical protein
MVYSFTVIADKPNMPRGK